MNTSVLYLTTAQLPSCFKPNQKLDLHCWEIERNGVQDCLKMGRWRQVNDPVRSIFPRVYHEQRTRRKPTTVWQHDEEADLESLSSGRVCPAKPPPLTYPTLPPIATLYTQLCLGAGSVEQAQGQTRVSRPSLSLSLPVRLFSYSSFRVHDRGKAFFARFTQNTPGFLLAHEEGWREKLTR